MSEGLEWHNNMFVDAFGCSKDQVPKGHCWHVTESSINDDGSKKETKRCCWCGTLMYSRQDKPHGKHV